MLPVSSAVDSGSRESYVFHRLYCVKNNAYETNKQMTFTTYVCRVNVNLYTLCFHSLKEENILYIVRHKVFT
jgi:hypothetical protein